MADPIVIVGGGLAGLACARALQSRNVPWRLLESSDRVGGRLRTDVVRGYSLDLGFQVHFAEYPTCKRLFDLAPLKPGKWASGAKVWDGSAIQIIDKANPFATLASPLFGLPDKLKTLELAKDCLKGNPFDGDLDISTREFLEKRGFSPEWFRTFAEPFFGGVFAEKALFTSAWQFCFLYGVLSKGPAVLPAEGIEAIARAVTAPLERYRISTYSPVERIEPGKVTLETGEMIAASGVVLAADPVTNARFLGEERPQGNQSTTFWYSSPEAAVKGSYLVLNGTGEGLVNSVAPITNAQPAYAPPGRHLVSASILTSDSVDETLVRAELRHWFPEGRVDAWELLRTDRIPYAQTVQPAGFRDRRPSVQTAMPGVFRAGEATENASIDGALLSGLKAAEAVARVI
ncbi:FAD-dependent oxidoreductase [bacterium]|nr:MAG: FAD-dependent oxidoreductase [bacterium]